MSRIHGDAGQLRVMGISEGEREDGCEGEREKICYRNSVMHLKTRKMY